MLENPENASILVEKLRKMTLELTQEWKPIKSSGYPGKPWRVVIPARITQSGKQTSRYFRKKCDAEAYIRTQLASLRKYGTINGRLTDLAAYRWNTVDQILSEVGINPLQAATHYVQLVQRAGSVAKLDLIFQLGLGVAPGAAAAAAPCLEELANMYERENPQHSAVTITSRRTRLKRMGTACPEFYLRPVLELTPDDIVRALDTVHADQPTSWNNMRKELATLLSFAVQQGFIVTNPCLKVKKRQADEQEIHAIHLPQLRRLFQACAPPPHAPTGKTEFERRLQARDLSDLKLHVAISAFAGVRPFELARLKWADISTEDAVISIRAKNAKTGGTRHITIRPNLMAWLLRFMPSAPDPEALVINPVDLKNKLQALHHRAGYGKGYPWPADCLRHSFASYALKSGEPIDRIAADMGHVNTEMLKKRYLNMRGLTKLAAAEYWALTPDQFTWS